MITHISHTLAQQIVNTIKDVCSYDINFINPSGTIIASTNSARIGTFHEIGRKAVATDTTIEVAESDNFTGTRQGINMPLYHEDNLLAVIGITGSPEKVRKYAFLAQRITSLLIREQELSQCPTYFGRKNKLGDAVRMMERYRDHTAPVGSPKLAENPTLVPRGIFTDEDQPEYCARYASIIASQHQE